MYKKTTTINELHRKFSTTDYPACKHLWDSMDRMGFELWQSIVDETYDRGGGFDLLNFMEDHSYSYDLRDVFFDLQDLGFCEIHAHKILKRPFVYFIPIIDSMYNLTECNLIQHVNEDVN